MKEEPSTNGGVSKVTRRQMILASAGALTGLASSVGMAAPALASPVLAPPRRSLALPPIPTKKIEDIMQTSGAMMGDVFLLSLARKDLSVKGPAGHVFSRPSRRTTSSSSSPCRTAASS